MSKPDIKAVRKLAKFALRKKSHETQRLVAKSKGGKMLHCWCEGAGCKVCRVDLTRPAFDSGFLEGRIAALNEAINRVQYKRHSIVITNDSMCMGYLRACAEILSEIMKLKEKGNSAV